MSDYGMKTSKKGESALSTDYANILMSTRFPFAKIDQTMSNSFRTTHLTFLNNTANGVNTEIYRFAHGYDYTPQMWGLWEITWGPGVPSSWYTFNGYGTVSSSTGMPYAYVSYGIDDTYVYLYAGWYDPFGLSPVDLTGTTLTLTTYIFADDLSEHDYTTND